MEKVAPMDNEVLNAQSNHWEKTFQNKPDMFGTEPSHAAVQAVDLFKKEGRNKILELGSGQGRDTIFLAQQGLQIYALDYCETGINPMSQKVEDLGLSESITTVCHDVRKPLPFEDEAFDGCYSHMLFCMALTTAELEYLSGEIRRVLKSGGLNIYTARNTNDAHYGTGIHRGEDMYEVGGFIVHFFSREQVEHLAEGYEIVEVEEFEEGALPKKLFKVVLRKP